MGFFGKISFIIRLLLPRVSTRVKQPRPLTLILVFFLMTSRLEYTWDQTHTHTDTLTHFPRQWSQPLLCLLGYMSSNTADEKVHFEFALWLTQGFCKRFNVFKTEAHTAIQRILFSWSGVIIFDLFLLWKSLVMVGRWLLLRKTGKNIATGVESSC